MNELMDSWKIDGKKWDLPYDFRVHLFHDGDVHPARDYDCYDEADITAWRRARWCFVTVEVLPVDEFGVVYEDARDTLPAVEWGVMPECTIGRERLEESHVRDMATKASGKADAIREKIVDRVTNGEPEGCPYSFAHTRHWCGYDGCREG